MKKKYFYYSNPTHERRAAGTVKSKIMFLMKDVYYNFDKVIVQNVVQIQVYNQYESRILCVRER